MIKIIQNEIKSYPLAGPITFYFDASDFYIGRTTMSSTDYTLRMFELRVYGALRTI